MVLAGGDDLEFYGGSTGRISNTGLICNNTTTSDAAVTQFWADLYSGIERANMLLEHIDNVPSMSAEKTAQYKSEARFLRAFYYFNLVQCWGEFVEKMNEQAEAAQVGNLWNQASQVVQFFRVTSAYRYFPIPDAERAVNKLITTNNPGW